MALNLSISQFVLLTLSIVALLGGMIYLLAVQTTSESAISQIPNQFIPGESGAAQAPPKLTVTPPSSQVGTIFSLVAQFRRPAEVQDWKVRIKKGDFETDVLLFDDGQHSDKQAGDGIYGGIFDSRSTSVGDYEVYDLSDNKLGAFEIYEPGCETVIGSGEPQDINFVIVPSQYTDISKFRQDTINILTGTDSLMETEPFKSNKDSFSFSIVKDLADLGCEIGCYGIDAAVCCEDSKVFEAASQCHHDQIIVLLDSDENCGTASSYAKICAGSPYGSHILTHELGHSFGNLADEYVYEGNYEDYSIPEEYVLESANCDREGCGKWSSTTTECVPGCTSPSLYRPSDNSIMRDALAADFNTVSSLHLSQLITSNVQQERDFDQNVNSWNSFFALLRYNDGKYVLDPLSVKPVRSSVTTAQSALQAKILDRSGDEIYTTPVQFARIEYSASELGVPPRWIDSATIPVILPFLPQSNSIEILENEVPVAQASVAMFSARCGDGVCDSSENNVVCATDCPLQDGLCSSTPCDPDCPDGENCSQNSRRSYTLPIVLILISVAIILALVIISHKKNKLGKQK